MDEIDSIIFDFDGVVVESVDIKTEAFAALYAPHGPEIVAKVIHHHLEHGSVSRFEKLRVFEEQFLGRPVTSAQLDALAQRFSDLVEEQVVHCPWVCGALELLETAAHETQLFVASGTPEDELIRIVRRRGISRFFKAVRGSPTKKVQIVRELVATFALSPSRTLMIGDSLGDYDAADASGLRFVGRVAPGLANSFSPNVPVVSDLRGLVNALSR